MGFKSVLVLALVSLAAPWATGQSSCLPAQTAVQTIRRIDPAQRTPWVFNLPQSRAQLVVDGSGRIVQPVFRFDPDFHGVSLPYNVYAIAMISNGEVIGWMDFTSQCRGPGLSFFPGREVYLAPIKLIGDYEQTLQIMVWGKI